MGSRHTEKQEEGQEATALSQSRNDGVVDQNSSSGEGKTCLGLGCILEVEPTGLTGGLERYLPASDLNSWGVGNAVQGVGKY